MITYYNNSNIRSNASTLLNMTHSEMIKRQLYKSYGLDIIRALKTSLPKMKNYWYDHDYYSLKSINFVIYFIKYKKVLKYFVQLSEIFIESHLNMIMHNPYVDSLKGDITYIIFKYLLTSKCLYRVTIKDDKWKMDLLVCT